MKKTFTKNLLVNYLTKMKICDIIIIRGDEYYG